MVPECECCSDQSHDEASEAITFGEESKIPEKCQSLDAASSIRHVDPVGMPYQRPFLLPGTRKKKTSLVMYVPRSLVRTSG